MKLLKVQNIIYNSGQCQWLPHMQNFSRIFQLEWKWELQSTKTILKYVFCLHCEILIEITSIYSKYPVPPINLSIIGLFLFCLPNCPLLTTQCSPNISDICPLHSSLIIKTLVFSITFISLWQLHPNLSPCLQFCLMPKSL